MNNINKQQQKDLENIIIKNTERYIDYDEECPFESRRVAEPDELAKKILKAGYHKTVWYKVKDNVLPPKNTHVRCVLNWCDILYYATGWYNDKGCWDYTDNVNGDAELIAWAYLPEYKK